MRLLGYIGIVFDLFLGNLHWLFSTVSLDTEWWSSDVAEFCRVTWWIFIALLWVRSNKTEVVIVGWYGLNTIVDIFQTISGTNGNPTFEILVFLAGALTIFLYSYFKYD